MDQRSDAELGSYEAAKASEWPAGKEKSEALLIGSEGAHELLPVSLAWEVSQDASGCLRIKKASLKRTGGPASVEIYDVKISPSAEEQCQSRLDGSNETFERVQISYCWRWNGAANAAHCAYSGGVTLNADKVGVEGKDKRRGASGPR